MHMARQVLLEAAKGRVCGHSDTPAVAHEVLSLGSRGPGMRVAEGA